MNGSRAMPAARRDRTAAAAGPCKASKGAVVEPLDRRPRVEARLEIGKIGVLARGVDDEVEAVWQRVAIRSSRMPPASFKQQRVAHPHRREPADVAGHQRLERRRRVGAREPQLAHMRDIEEPGRGAGMAMLGEDAGGILERHRLAGELARCGRRAFGAARRAGCAAGRQQRPGPRACLRQSGRVRVPIAPSVVDPERFTGPALSTGLGLLLRRAAGLRGPAAAFQSALPPAVLLPESFRGGCSFGAAFPIPIGEAASPAGVQSANRV